MYAVNVDHGLCVVGVSQFGLNGADVVFFFSSGRRHTSSLCDWSSDVCSSDLTMPGTISTKHVLIVPGIVLAGLLRGVRSEERRVGKECRSRWSRYHQKKRRERTELGARQRRRQKHHQNDIMKDVPG